MTRAIIYAYTASSEPGSDTRIRSQVQSCTSHAQQCGYEIVRVIEEIACRTFFKDIFKMADAHEFDILLLVRLDRLSRDLSEIFYVLQQMKESGIKVESLEDPSIQRLLPTRFFEHVLTLAVSTKKEEGNAHE